MNLPSAVLSANVNDYTANDDYSFIVSVKTNKAVQVSGTSTDPVTADAEIIANNGNTLSPKALFKMLKSPTNANYVSFSSVSNNWNMLKSENRNGLDVITNSNAKKTEVGGWEAFTLIPQSDGTFAMKDGRLNRYVSINNENKLVTTTSNTITNAEKFIIKEPALPDEPNQVAIDIYIEHVASGNIVTADGVVNNPINVSLPKPTAPTTVPSDAIFKLEHGSHNGIATVNFRSSKNTLWKGTNNSIFQISGSTKVGGWESVQAVPQGDGTVAFKQMEGSKYISVSNGKLVPLSTDSAPTNNEKFVIHTNSTPKKVRKISVSEIEGDTLKLSWSTLEGTIFSGFEVWRSETPGGPYMKVCNETLSTTYIDTGLKFSTTYYYVVRTVNGPSPYAQSLEFSATTMAGNRPGAPKGLDIKEAGINIQLKWSYDANVKEYDILRAGGKFGSYQKIASTTDTTFVDTNPNTSKYENYYKVVGKNDFGISKESKIVSLETKLFGDNMIFYNAKYDNVKAIGKEVNDIHDNKTFKAQFSTERYGLYFKPGNYIDAGMLNIGYYTQIAGLGKTPLDTKIYNMSTPAPLPSNNATCTFWRSAENFTVADVENNADPFYSLKWGVSQAAPLRRMNVERSSWFDWWYGWSSGGYIADSVFKKNAGSWTQQQWYTRNSVLPQNGWYGVNWNGFFQGVENAPGNTWDKGGNPYTSIAATPIVREKPFLYQGDDGEYKVFVPAIQKEHSGVSWSAENMGLGETLDISKFYIAKEGVDTADSLNKALDKGKHIFFTPGIYELDQTLHVKNPNTIILGTGLATLVPNNDKAAIVIEDVPGVIIAGLLFDAYYSSKNLLQVGSENSEKNHKDNPTSLIDLYFRVGGFKEENVNVDAAVEINSNNVIADHFWVWRADHGAGVGWNQNTSKNGLVVNGDDVTAYGMFVEHFQEYQTLWNGENGRLYFYQSETPYDPQDQNNWMSQDGTVKGYSSYKVANSVKNHYAVGLGIYDVFINTNGASIFIDNAIEVPHKENVVIENACIVEIANSNGPLVGINSIVNGTGTGISTGIGGKGYAREFILKYQNGVATLLNGTATGNEPIDSPDDWRRYIQPLIEQVEVLKPSKFTKTSWSVLTESLVGVVNLVEDDSATTTSLEEAYAILDKALKDLKVK
jgi:hypothetical protein